MSQHNLTAVVVACILGLTTSLMSVQAQTSSLYRPDIKWYTGQFGIQIGGDIITTWDWSSGQLELTTPTNPEFFRFNAANASYTFPSFSLQANGCFIHRSFSDSVTSLLRFDSIDLLRPTLCENGAATGYEFVLPIGDSTLVYSTEVYKELEDRRSWLHRISGHAFSYLNINDLNTLPANIVSEAVESEFEIRLQDSILDACSHYISNPNGGWWGVARSATSNRFQRWAVGENGVQVLRPDTAGLSGFRRERSIARIAFRPTGEFFAISGTDDGIGLYSFDRQTASIEHVWQVPISYDTTIQVYRDQTDCAFSACGRYLYVTNINHLWQFDTYAEDITASKVLINDLDRLPFVTGYYEIERGPDCRIYIGWPSRNKVVSVIDKPSRKGRACELFEQGIEVLSLYNDALPHFPDYSLWAKDRVARGLAPLIDTAVCDSNIQAFPYRTYATSTRRPAHQVDNSILFPNPAAAGQMVTIPKLPQPLDKGSKIARIYNTSGQVVYTKKVNGSQASYQFLLPNLPKGFYRVLIGEQANDVDIISASLVVQ